MPPKTQGVRTVVCCAYIPIIFCFACSSVLTHHDIDNLHDVGSIHYTITIHITLQRCPTPLLWPMASTSEVMTVQRQEIFSKQTRKRQENIISQRFCDLPSNSSKMPARVFSKQKSRHKLLIFHRVQSASFHNLLIFSGFHIFLVCIFSIGN